MTLHARDTPMPSNSAGSMQTDNVAGGRLPVGESPATRERRWSGNALARKAESRLGHVALIGIGTRAAGPLLLVLSADVDAALDKAQVYHVDPVAAWALVWTVGKPVAELIKPEVLRMARERARHGRGGWLLLSAVQVEALIVEAATALGLDGRVMSAARHDQMVLQKVEGGVW